MEFEIKIGGVRIGTLTLEIPLEMFEPYIARLAMFGIKAEKKGGKGGK